MAFTIVTTRTILARNAGALYNLELGSTDMGTLVTQAGTTTDSVNAFLNTIYTNSVGTAATTAVAAELVNNLGITDPAAITSATDYIVGQLNAVAYTARGAVVNNIISLFTGLTADPVFGTFATTYNTKIANAEAYAAVSTNTGNATFGGVSTQPAGQTFTLTNGIDTFTGGSGNDTFNSSVIGGLSALDNLDGGTGTNTLTVSDTNPIAVSPTTKVANIQTATLSSGGTVGGDLSSWTGLTQLTVSEIGGSGTGLTAAGTTAVTVTDSAQAAGNITVNGGSSVTITSTGATNGTITVGTTTAPTGAVVINETATNNGTGGAINVSGGTTVNITQTAANAINTTHTNGAVNVSGGAATTSVTINNSAIATASLTKAGVVANSVSISDVNGGTTKAGTITSATVSNYTTLGISDNALTTLNLTGGSGNIIIDNSGLTTPTNKTLGLTVNGLTAGTLDDADIYTTLNVTTAGADSTLSNITTGAVATLTVAGTKGLTLNSAAGLVGALKTVTVSGSAGLTADFTLASKVTAVDTSATTGASKVTIDGSKATFTGGAGADTVTVVTGATKAISLGAGDDSLTLGALVPTAAISGGAGTDTLSMDTTAAATASSTPSFAGLVTGFEHLTLTGAAVTKTIDLAVLGNFNYVTTSGGTDVTLANLSSGATLALTGAGTKYTIGSTSAFTSGTNDTVNLALTDGSGAGVSFAATGITASGVENFVITTADTQATPTGTFNDLVTVLGNSAKTITVSGNAGLTLTAASTALTSVDASGITGTTTGGFSWTSGALAAAATVKGSVAGANTVDASAATGGAVTYTGGTGNDVFTATNGKANVVTLGDGTNSATVSSGNNTITGGTGADTVIATTGNNTVTLGNGANAFTATSGNNTYTGGTGVDTVTVGGGTNTLTLGTGADVVSITAAGSNVNTYTTITDAHAGVAITFVDKGTETFNTTKVALAPTAVFQDYANAVVQAGGNASIDGAFGWFQFSGNTYLVESRHDGSGNNASFVNGTDMIISLTGLVDLSAATGTGTATLTLV
ncbi:beta strand repeat-containing protein [Methylobacter sp.]|uniref:beta strand repeat-containing protein n=1 Tax=Methylobacter sp. TaxID=2051955 RepID=UPI002FDEC55B